MSRGVIVTRARLHQTPDTRWMEKPEQSRAGSWGVVQLRRLKVSALDGISIIPGPPEAATRAPAPVPRVKDAANLCNSCEGLVLFIQAATMYY